MRHPKDVIDSNLAKHCKIVFADLDDTLTTTLSGAKFPQGEWDWRPKLEVWEALKRMNVQYLCIVTNQGGIECGFVDESRFVAKLECIVRQLSLYLPDCQILWEYCKFNDKSNELRKPNVGMFTKHYERLIKLGTVSPHDMTDVLMIGDASGTSSNFSTTERNEDYQFVRNVNAKYDGCMHYLDVNEFVYRAIGFTDAAKYATTSFDKVHEQVARIKRDAETFCNS